MNTNHTPGPWKAVHNAPFCWGIYGPDGRWIAQTDRPFDDGSERAPEECEANARLIAAGPLVLAALKALMAALPRDWTESTLGDDARAAITEAEPEPSI